MKRSLVRQLGTICLHGCEGADGGERSARDLRGGVGRSRDHGDLLQSLHRRPDGPVTIRDVVTRVPCGSCMRLGVIHHRIMLTASDSTIGTTYCHPLAVFIRTTHESSIASAKRARQQFISHCVIHS